MARVFGVASRRFFALVAGLGLVAAGCGGGTGSTTSAALTTTAATTTTTTTTATTTTAVTTTTTTTLPEVLSNSTSVSDLDGSVVAELTTTAPDELLVLKSNVWIKTDDGRLVQVDPADNSISVDVRIDTTTDTFHYCQGLGTDGVDIWACSAAGDADNRTVDVVRFDPATQQVVATFEVDKIFDQRDLPFLDQRIWVLTGTGDQMVGIDVVTGDVSAPVELGVRCFQLAATDSAIIAACPLSDLVLRIGVETMEITAQMALESPGLIAADEEGVWVAQDRAIVRMDPDSLVPLVRFAGLSAVYDILVAPDGVWVRVSGSDFLYRIDPTTDQFVGQFEVDQPIPGGSLLVTSDSVWVTANDDNLLVRFTLE